MSLARPRWGYTWEKEKHHGRDILIAIDVSKSMLANDLSPSRLARAKLAAEDLIGQVPGDRVGLIAFAGTAFLQAPLTADHGAVLDALHELDTDIIPRGGTNIAEAIRTAVDAFGKGESDNRALVLFTDGEELEEDAVQAAKNLNGAARIFTVGLGSAEGTVIAIPGENGQTDYVKDSDGQIVKSRLDEPRLREIAQAANGFYVHLANGPPEMQQIVRDGLNPMTEHDVNSEHRRRPIERYQWPLSAGLALLVGSLLIGERKRLPRAPAPALGVALLLACFSAVASAKNPGLEAYEREDYKGASDSFDQQLQHRPDSPELQFDLGSAAYKIGDMDRAMQSFGNAITSKDPALREKAEYNLGNTLVQRGIVQKEKPAEIQELRNALQHYDAALQVQPQDANAKYNRDLVQKMIAELEKEPPKQQQQDQKDKKDQKDQKDQQKQQSKQDQSQQSKDQKDQKDQQNQDKSQSQSQDQKDQQQQQQNSQQQNGGSGQQQQKDGQQSQPQSGQEGKEGQDQQQQQQQPKPQDADGQQKSEQPKPAQPDKDKDKDKDKDQQQGQQQQQQQQQQPPQDGQQAGAPKDQGQNAQPAQQQPADEAKSGEPQQPQDASAEQPQRKLSGELKDQGQAPPADDAKAAQQEAAEAAEEAKAAAENRMTENQARSLLDSLKDEDVRVRLLKPGEKKSPPGSYRDW